jgi:hypothetical protein
MVDERRKQVLKFGHWDERHGGQSTSSRPGGTVLNIQRVINTASSFHPTYISGRAPDELGEGQSVAA